MKTKKPVFTLQQYTRNRWLVIAPSGIPVYDNAPHGKDKPLIFREKEDALDYAKRCTQQAEDEPDEL